MGDYFMMERMQFVAGWSDCRLNNGLKFDILVDMTDFEDNTFDECLQIATIANIENIKIPFLHSNQIVANKKAVNCGKDIMDVVEPEKIKLLRKEMGLD